MTLVAKRKSVIIGKSSKLKLDDETKRRLITEHGFLDSEMVGYGPGHEIQDWLDAEAKVVTQTKGDK